MVTKEIFLWDLFPSTTLRTMEQEMTIIIVLFQAFEDHVMSAVRALVAMVHPDVVERE
jgi:hypothetical protein